MYRHRENILIFLSQNYFTSLYALHLQLILNNCCPLIFTLWLSRTDSLWLFTIFTVLQYCFMLSYDHLNGLLNPISSRWSKMFLVSQMSARKTEWQAVKIFIWNNDKYHDASMHSAMIVQDGLFSEFYLVDYSLLFQIKMPIFEYIR